MKKRIWSILIVFCMIIGLVTNMQVMSVSASNTAGDLVSIAQGELGNGCSKYTHYVGSINGSYNYAWCAAFVSWCGNQAGVSCISKTASCYAQYQYMTSHGGYEVSSPQAGDIVFFYCGNCSGTANQWCHIGIMINSTTSIDGNYYINGSSKVAYDNSYSHYGSLGYKHSSGIRKIYVRPNYGVNSAILPGTIDSSWNVPTTVTATHRITTYNEYGNAESDHYIDPGDSCYITEVYTNGFVKVQYPIPGGKRWAYAKASDFPLEKQFGNPVDLGTNFYAYIINTYAWKHLTNDGCNVSMRSETGAANQVWRFERQGDGSYKIISCKDNLVLDDQNFGQTNGTNVAVCANNDSTAQRWFIYGSSGAYYLKAKCGNLVLDVNGASKADGTNIQMWEKNDTVAQKFQIWKLNVAGKAAFSVSAGTSTTETKFSWNKTSDTTRYVVKIWKNKVWQGSSFKEFETKNTSWSVKLPEGTYEAYVDSNNSFSCTCSNIVRFTIKKGECTHKFGNWTTTKKATCTTDGREQRKCSLCGKTESRTVKATGHKFTSKVVEPTYEQSGYELHTCSNCGYSYKDHYTDVKPKQLISISVTSMPKKISYFISEPLDTTGMKVTASYSDGSKKEVGGWKIDGNTNKAGGTSIRVEYTEGGKTAYTTFEITVKQRKKETITITYYDYNGNMYGAPAHYASNQSFDLIKEYPDIYCRIQLDPDGGSPSQSSVAVSAPFLGWYTSMGARGTRYAPGQSVSFSSSINLYAGYGDKTIGTLPQPYKEGYSFKGWYTKDDGKQVLSGATVSDGCELVARWEKKEIEENEKTQENEDKQDEELGDYENPDGDGDEDEDAEDPVDIGDEIATDEAIYTVTKLGKAPCVEYAELFDDDVQNVVIPSTITENGVTYSVTSVSEKAFYKNTGIRSVTIGKNVEKIGSKAFYGCKNLTKIVIKTEKLKSGNVGSKAFTKVSQKAKAYVPKEKYSAYKKILKKAGIGSKAKIYKSE